MADAVAPAGWRDGRSRDTYGRPLRNLRISVTDRCNLRCGYCMPEEEYVWLPREEILHFEEISRLVDVFIDARRRQGAAHRRRAAAAPRSAARWSACSPPSRRCATSR